MCPMYHYVPLCALMHPLHVPYMPLHAPYTLPMCPHMPLCVPYVVHTDPD